ncbi:MAG: hypothetical protein J5685_08685, partial [Clostridiales bacterium]|nr:hypothetical protein [Clostridiales bacterium]
MNLKHLKIRIIGIALTLSMLSGGVVVSADGPNVTAALSYGQTVHVSLAAGERGKFYSFTPETSGLYSFYSTNQRRGNPYLQFYDSSMQLIASENDTTDWSDFNLVYDCTAGQTYYLYAMEYDTPDAAEYDLGVGWGATGTATGDVASIVPVWGNFYRVGVRSDSYQLVVNPFSCDDTEFTVYWSDEDGHEVGTGNTYTPDHFGNYECIVRGPDRSVVFWFTVFHDYELRFDNDSMFEYMLVDKDTDILIDPAFTIADQTVEVHSQRWNVFPDFDANSNRSAEIIEQDPHGFLFSGGIHDFSSFWFRDYIPNGSYNEKGKYITVFVMDGETDGVLVPDEPVHIETDNNGEWYDILFKKEDYTYQQIYSFTSPSDGTATFEITDIVKGVPCIVLFDSGYNMIGCVNAAELLYSYGNRVYPGFDTRGV